LLYLDNDKISISLGELTSINLQQLLKTHENHKDE